MSATWTQASHVRHPWLHAFAMKRKFPSTDMASDDDSAYARDVAPPATKRRRCSTLERGFAHLSLTHPFPAAASVEASEDIDMLMDPAAGGGGVTLLSAVEEPTPVVDVQMRKSTWYEPEPDRIVITELESSSDEEAESQDVGQLYVPPTLLSHIRSRILGPSLDPPRDHPLTSSTSRALVLFRPLQLPSTVTGSPRNSSGSISHAKNNANVKEEDIMDVEL